MTQQHPIQIDVQMMWEELMLLDNKMTYGGVSADDALDWYSSRMSRALVETFHDEIKAIIQKDMGSQIRTYLGRS